MTFNPRGSVQDGLDLLAQRLSVIIPDRLSTSLQGLEWTVILRELDNAKGYANKQYSPLDLQAQLRMLTERLGGLGYPFDDPQTRIVSTLGGELRIMRNRRAHGHQLTALDAWRTHDFVVRLLEHFDDAEGLVSSEKLRLTALEEVARESGVMSSRVPVELVAAPQLVEPIVSASGSLKGDTSEDEVHPDPSMLIRRNAAETPRIGSQRSEFEPWNVVPVGDASVLDDLPKKVAKEQVRAVAVEIADFEGPIHLDRLAELTAASFGLNKLHPKRRGQISRQITAAGLNVDTDKFVWPESIDPEVWGEFRPSSSEIDRPFTRISPVEIRNAARFIQDSDEAMTRGELETLTLQTFGRKRRTTQFVKHLARALDIGNRK